MINKSKGRTMITEDSIYAIDTPQRVLVKEKGYAYLPPHPVLRK